MAIITRKKPHAAKTGGDKMKEVGWDWNNSHKKINPGADTSHAGVFIIKLCEEALCPIFACNVRLYGHNGLDQNMA